MNRDGPRFSARVPLRALILGVAVVVAGAVLTAPQPVHATSTAGTYSFANSSLAGGGIQNDAVPDPRHNGVVLSGSDVAGIQRSTDFGVTWVSANAGYDTVKENAIASIAFDPAAPDTVFAAYGSGQPGNAGVIVSQDDGITWSHLPAGPLFNGTNSSNAGAGKSRERCTGRLMAIDDSTVPATVYALGFNDGVWRYDGISWTSIVRQAQLGSAKCNTSLVWAATDSLAASTWSQGIFVLSGVSGTPTVASVPGSPTVVQELVALGDGHIWGAADLTGVGYFTANGSWTTVLFASGEEYMAIDGYTDGGPDVVYAADASSATVPGQTVTASVEMTADSGATWSPLPSSASVVSNQLLGPQNGNPWWNFTTGRIGVHWFIPQSISVAHSPTQGDDVWVADDGVWRLLGQESQATFYPSDSGMGNTYLHQVVIDPSTKSAARSGQHVFVGAADWGLLSSSNGFETQQGIADAHPGAGSVGYDTVVDGYNAASPLLYLATGSRSTNTNGELFRGVPGQTLLGQGLKAATGGGRPLALGVVDTNGTPTVVVPVEGSGMWTRLGRGAWTQDTSLFLSKQESPVWGSVAVGHGLQGRTVYAFDGLKGLYRSTNAGAKGSWHLIWAVTNKDPSFLWVDTTDPTRLWVSLDSGLYRLDNAATSVFTNPVPAVPAVNSGPIVQFGGLIFFADLVPGTGLELLVSDPTESTFSDMADATLHQTYARASGMDIADDGTLYIPTSGHGLLVGTVGAAL
jgi:hypothetical protein